MERKRIIILKDTTRGYSNRIVRAGTVVEVVAERMDPDGMKLLVAIGIHGQPFQVRASCTNWGLS